MRLLPRLLPSAALLAAALAGCSGGTGVNTLEFEPTPALAAEGADGETRRALEYIVTDRGLNQIARVVSARQFFGQGSTPQVQVAVRNTSRKPQRFVYSWVWLDGDFEVDSPLSGDRTISIKPREVKTLRGTAPSDEVEGWRLRLSRAAG